MGCLPAKEEEDTHRYENAVQVARLPGFFVGPHNGSQLGDVIHSHNVDVVFAAESLDEGEVDLEGNVPLVLLISGQHAEGDRVRVTAEGTARREQRLLPGPPKQAGTVAAAQAEKGHPELPFLSVTGRSQGRTRGREEILTHSSA